VGAGAERDASPLRRPAPSPPTFATVSIATPRTPVSCGIETQQVEIMLVNGRRLHVGLGVDAVALQRLVAALEPAT